MFTEMVIKHHSLEILNNYYTENKRDKLETNRRSSVLSEFCNELNCILKHHDSLDSKSQSIKAIEIHANGDDCSTQHKVLHLLSVDSEIDKELNHAFNFCLRTRT